ncbi:MAG: OadG family protein [Chloroflexi bacterium]|nr:OadG family protein [Chloroflexota bacterium]
MLVTGAGMGVVFAVLVLLQIAIKGLGAFDRVPVPAEAAPSAAVPAERPAVAEGAAPEVAAAIGVALALAEEEARSPGGGVSTAGGVPAPGWVQAGRGRAMNARQREGRERGGR